jgi:hypothetical protein
MGICKARVIDLGIDIMAAALEEIGFEWVSLFAKQYRMNG